MTARWPQHTVRMMTWTSTAIPGRTVPGVRVHHAPALCTSQPVTDVSLLQQWTWQPSPSGWSRPTTTSVNLTFENSLERAGRHPSQPPGSPFLVVGVLTSLGLRRDSGPGLTTISSVHSHHTPLPPQSQAISSDEISTPCFQILAGGPGACGKVRYPISFYCRVQVLSVLNSWAKALSAYPFHNPAHGVNHTSTRRPNSARQVSS